MKHLAIIAICAVTAARLLAAGEITLRTCEGSVKSDFNTLGVDVEWNIEWPEEITGVKPKVLKRIQYGINLEAFVCPFVADLDSIHPPAIYDRPDVAQKHLFEAVLRKINETEDSHVTRALSYCCTLKICLATEGYIGYTIAGYHNEGGNGCHSYARTRIFSLNTGKRIQEHDLLNTNKYTALRKLIVDKASKEQNTSTMPDEVAAYSDVMSDGLFDRGNFMIEPGGIRWYIPPYSVFCGAAGVVDTLVPWDDLKPFFIDPAYCDALKNITATARTVIRKKDD